MTQLALSASFEYLCYGSTVDINSLHFHCVIDFKRQNLTVLAKKELTNTLDPRELCSFASSPAFYHAHHNNFNINANLHIT